MNFKTSLFNKGMFLNFIKRFGRIGLLYFTFLLFIIPIRVIYTLSNSKLEFIQEHFYHIQEIFSFRSPFILLSVLIIPIFIGLILFRYIQTKNTSDLIHSLPIKRESLFISNIIFGLLLIVLPVLLIALISTIVFLSFGLSNHLYIILNWMIATLVFNIIFFSVSVFSGMITGKSTLQGILTYILLILPYGLSKLIVINTKNLVYGFFYNDNHIYNLENITIKFSPINRLFIYFDYNDFTIQEIIIYLLISVIVIVTSYYLYKLRQTESATQSITFKILKPILKYSVTFSGMLLAGVYFNYKSSYLWMIFGYIIGSLLGYYISEMIIRKSFHVFKNNIKGYLVYVIAVVIIFTASISIYESYMPNEGDIESFSFGSVFITSHGFFYENGVSLKSKENLKVVRNFHKDVVRNEKIYRYYNGSTQHLYLSYKLKNGKQVFRKYEVPDEIYKKYFKPVIESIEYKKSRYDIFKYGASEIKEMIFEFYKVVNKHITVKNKNDFSKLKVIIENEVINMKYDDMYQNSNGQNIHISIYPEPEHFKETEGFFDNRITLPKKSKDLIENWLFENGYKR